MDTDTLAQMETFLGVRFLASEYGTGAKHRGRIDTLGLDAAALQPQVVLKRQFVPQVQGNCEFLSGTPPQIAQALMARIRQA